MHKWYRTTAEVPLMSMTYVGEVFPRTVLFLNTGLAVAAGQDIPVGEPEPFPYGMETVHMMPIRLHGQPLLYILGALADPKSPHCAMAEIEKK